MSLKRVGDSTPHTPPPSNFLLRPSYALSFWTRGMWEWLVNQVCKLLKTMFKLFKALLLIVMISNTKKPNPKQRWKNHRCFKKLFLPVLLSCPVLFVALFIVRCIEILRCKKSHSRFFMIFAFVSFAWRFYFFLFISYSFSFR